MPQFPGIASGVFPTFGNHESLPIDQYNLAFDETKAYFGNVGWVFFFLQ